MKYVNVKALRNDADLEDLYDAWKEGAGSRLEAHGISLQRRQCVCSPTRLWANASPFLSASFDPDEVREDLDDRHYKKDEYKGVEVWERGGGLGF